MPLSYQPDFPFVKGDNRGYFRFLPGESKQNIRGRLIQLLVTTPGERVHFCDFGVGLPRFLMEPLDDLSLREIRSRIVRQMATYEPSLAVKELNIDVTSYGPPAAVLIRMMVEIKQTKERQVLSFPIGV